MPYTYEVCTILTAKQTNSQEVGTVRRCQGGTIANYLTVNTTATILVKQDPTRQLFKLPQLVQKFWSKV